jgi:hypothetical protein
VAVDTVRNQMPAPVVSRLWIAAAERMLDAELQDVPQESTAEVRAHLRVAAITAEDLLNAVAGARGAARTRTVATLVERFGDQALDINYVGAAFIEEAVVRALVEIGIADVDAEQIAARCGTAVREAGAAIDTLTALTRR